MPVKEYAADFAITVVAYAVVGFVFNRIQTRSERRQDRKIKQNLANIHAA